MFTCCSPVLRRTLPVLLLLPLLACEADPLPSTDGAMPGDVAVDDGSPGDANDVSVAPMDAAPAPIDRGPDLDARAPDVAVDMAPPDAEPDLGDDIVEVDPPDHALVAVTRRGADTIFVWLDPEGAVTSMLVDDHGVAAEPEALETPDIAPDRIVARDVGGHPWVAFGAEGAPVVVFQADLPQATRIELDLYGPPQLAAAGNGVLVVARAEDGGLAWQWVGNDLDVEPVVADPFGLDLPDDVAGAPAGVVLYYGGAGQCVQISSDGWRPTGNFVCPTGDGQLISDGRDARLTTVAAFGVDQVVRVVPVYADDADYLVLYLELATGLAFADDGARRPMVGARLLDRNRLRRISLTFVDPFETWDTVETWSDFGDTPFGRVRALARRTFAERPTTLGVCESELTCTDDADCETGACEPLTTSEYAVGLDFRRDGAPRVRRWPLKPRNILDPPYGIDPHRGCVPEVERCDLIDQDCDGFVDDGRCCEGTADISYRWETPAPIATREVDGRLEYDFLFADVEAANGYRVFYRLDGTDRWEGRFFPMRQDPGGQPFLTGVTFDGATDGFAVAGAGGLSGLLARRVPVEGGEGGWALFIGHPSRDEPGEDPPRPVVDIDCDTVLAMDVLDHRSPGFGNEAGEQFVVVCRDKILRIHAVREGRDGVFPLQQFDLLDAGWATIYRAGVGELEIILGYEVPGEGWVVRALQLDADRPGGPEVGLVPAAVETMGAFDGAWPIHRHPVPGRAPVQIRSDRTARLAFRERDTAGREFTVWRDTLLAPDPRRTVYSPRRFRVFSAGPADPEPGFDEATGWWAADITGNNDFYNLWSTAPVFTVQGRVAAWHASKGSYGSDDQALDVGRYDLAIITPTDGTDRRWRLVTRETRCFRP